MKEETDNSVRIAVVEEQIRGLREQAASHNTSTINRLNHIESKVDDLMAIMNRGKGAFAVSVALAGTIGAAVMAAIQFIPSMFHK